MGRAKTKSHILMVVLLLIWTVDTYLVSAAEESLHQIFLLCFKTICSLPVLVGFMALTEGLRLPKRKDLPLLACSSFLGNILYFYLEYTAFKYLPVSLVMVLLGIMPVVSYLVECVRTRRAPLPVVLLAALLSVLGLALVVWDSPETGRGTAIGCGCGLLCVVVWIVYGYVVRRLDRAYSTAAITLYESVIASVLMLPMALCHMPAVLSTQNLWVSIVLMGLVATGFGYLIEVRGLIELGTTVSGIYVNFLPVFTAVAGYLFFGQPMTLLQLAGSALVILCGLFVILRVPEAAETA